jgi:cob(I)alamin adenosyltransferase
MSIITKRGDTGETDLLFSRRICKTSQRVAAMGVMDELNAALGLARVSGLDDAIIPIIDRLQDRLVAAMGMIATLPQDIEKYTYARITADDVTWIETTAHESEARGIRFRDWARPGAAGALAAAHLDMARTIARRAERECRILDATDGPVDPQLLLFCNRISDLLWILARIDESSPPMPSAPESAPA